MFSKFVLLVILVFQETHSNENNVNKFIVTCTPPNSDDLISETKILENRISQLQKTLENSRCSSSSSANSQNDDLFHATYPKSCKEVQERGYTLSNVYLIQPRLAPQPFMVFCDMKTVGGSWAYIMNRYFGGEMIFDLEWNSYKEGFGNLVGQFWLGLEKIHYITKSEVNELLLELVDWSQQKKFFQCEAFIVGDEKSGYALKFLGKCEDHATNAFVTDMKFSTKDRDQDLSSDNCAVEKGGGWWYSNNCSSCPLASAFIKDATDLAERGIKCGDSYFMQARVMIRPRSNKEMILPHEQSL